MPRASSLFVRLLIAQVVVTVALTATLAAVFYLERNRTVAQLVAVRWTPALKRLAGGATPESLGERAPGAVYTASGRPADAFELASMTPRLAMVREALLDEGLPVLELVLTPPPASGGTVPVLWLALRGDDGATRWVGFESGVVETRLRERLVLALLLLAALAVAASALVARRLARPLEALRARIAADDTGGAPLPQASAEVQAIDQAWRTLRLSLDR
jgi:two-component system, OmpR family, osmolarity sensor histidine kinase EnvZ